MALQLSAGQLENTLNGKENIKGDKWKRVKVKIMEKH